MTDRNDPCPCGSGKKRKHCHAETNPHVRMINGREYLTAQYCVVYAVAFANWCIKNGVTEAGPKEIESFRKEVVK